MPTQKNYQLLIFVNLHRHAKNYTVSFICSEDINLKIKESDWLRPFWLISREQDFSQIKDLCRNTTNNTNFHCTTNSVKIIYQIFL